MASGRTLINGHGLLLRLYLSLTQAKARQAKPSRPGVRLTWHHLSKDARLWSYLSSGLSLSLVFFFFFWFALFMFLPPPHPLFGHLIFFKCHCQRVLWKTPLSLEDFMPLPGDFKLINHIKCFAVPRPESPGSVPRVPEIVHKQTIKIKDKAQK